MFAPTADVLARETPAVLRFGAELLHREVVGVEVAEDREFQVIAASDTRDVATRICSSWVEILRGCGPDVCGA